MIMQNWFECKVKLDKPQDDGKIRKVTELYLVDALNFTEAEKRMLKEMKPYTTGELEVADLKRAKYGEMFTTTDESADKWFKVKCVFVTLDEKTQTEKRTSTLMLVQASDLRDAVKRFDDGMKGSMVDYEINTVQETLIMDVFPYEAEPEKK